jgi:hypothetical protein
MSVIKTNGSFKVTIVSTGIAVSLVNQSLRTDRIDIQAVNGNAGAILVGDSTITNDLAHGGISLSAGDVYSLELIKDALLIYINGTAGDSVTVNWWVGDRN